jgi:hypothetical protein
LIGGADSGVKSALHGYKIYRTLFSYNCQLAVFAVGLL